MSDPRAFISFDYDHNENEKHLFIGQSKNSKSPFSIEDWSSKASLPQPRWEALIKEKINKCHMLIVLVGQKTASATGVTKEIAMAKAQNIPFFGIYVERVSLLNPLPTGLESNRIIPWDWDKIADKIDQMMREGRNN